MSMEEVVQSELQKIDELQKEAVKQGLENVWAKCLTENPGDPNKIYSQEELDQAIDNAKVKAKEELDAALAADAEQDAVEIKKLQDAAQAALDEVKGQLEQLGQAKAEVDAKLAQDESIIDKLKVGQDSIQQAFEELKAKIALVLG